MLEVITYYIVKQNDIFFFTYTCNTINRGRTVVGISIRRTQIPVWVSFWIVLLLNILIILEIRKLSRLWSIIGARAGCTFPSKYSFINNACSSLRCFSSMIKMFCFSSSLSNSSYMVSTFYLGEWQFPGFVSKLVRVFRLALSGCVFLNRSSA